MWRLPLCTPKVSPTISGEIVERRDQVLIAGGFFPPSAIRFNCFATLRSMNGPFFNERGIFQFWIADFGSRISPLHRPLLYLHKLENAIRENPQSAIPNPNHFLLRSFT